MPPLDEPPAEGAPLPETSPEARALYAEATALSAARKHREAVEAWRACLRTGPDQALARIGLCESLWAAGEREAAKAEAGPLEELVPRDEPTWRRAFALLRKLGDRTRAEVVTQHFISAVGGTAEARIELVAIQPLPGPLSRDRIEADLADALQHAAEEPVFWRRVAEQQRRFGRIDDALDAIEHALRIKPDDFAARCDQVEILVRQDKERLARKHLAEIVPFIPDTAQGWLQIAEIATEAHDAAIARHAIDRAIAIIKPEWHGPRLRLARIMLAHGDERAIEIIRDLTAECEDPDTLRHLFKLCYDQNFNELALDAGRKLATLGPLYDVATRMQGLEFAGKASPRPGAPPASLPASARRPGWLGRLLGR